MIIREKNSFKANHHANTSLNEDPGIKQSKSHYENLLGLTYNNHLESHIPNRFKWGISMIKVVD